MEKWCLYASSFIFDKIIIKIAGNQDKHKSSVEFGFEPNQFAHFWVICPWMTLLNLNIFDARGSKFFLLRVVPILEVLGANYFL